MKLIDADAIDIELAYKRDPVYYRNTFESGVRNALSVVMNAPTIEAEPVVYCWQCANRDTEECPMRWTVYLTEDDEGYYEVEIPYDETKTWGFCHKGRREG